MSRITDEQLLAFAADELSGPEADEIRTHVAAHEDAARRVALYRLAAARTAGDDTVPAPAPAVARAKAVFAARPTADRPGLADRLQELVASLVYDSRLQPAAVRFSGPGQRVQLAFEAGDVDVDLRAERQTGDDDRWRITGQLGADPAPGVIDVTVTGAGGAEPLAELRSDDRALFSIELPSGTYDFRLAAGDRVVLLPGVEIG